MLAAALRAGGQSAGAPRPVVAPPWADTHASNSPDPSRRGSSCVAVTAIIVAPQQAEPAIAIAGRHRLTSGSKQRCYRVFYCHRYPYGSQVANCILPVGCSAALQAAGPGIRLPGSRVSGGLRRGRPQAAPRHASPRRPPVVRRGIRPHEPESRRRPDPRGAGGARSAPAPGRGPRQVPGEGRRSGALTGLRSRQVRDPAPARRGCGWRRSPGRRRGNDPPRWGPRSPGCARPGRRGAATPDRHSPR